MDLTLVGEALQRKGSLADITSSIIQAHYEAAKTMILRKDPKARIDMYVNGCQSFFEVYTICGIDVGLLKDAYNAVYAFFNSAPEGTSEGLEIFAEAKNFIDEAEHIRDSLGLEI